MEMSIRAHSEILNSNRFIPITIDDYYKSEKAINTFKKMGGGQPKKKKPKSEHKGYTTVYGEHISTSEAEEAASRLGVPVKTIANRVRDRKWNKYKVLNQPKSQGKKIMK